MAIYEVKAGGGDLKKRELGISRREYALSSQRPHVIAWNWGSKPNLRYAPRLRSSST